MKLRAFVERFLNQVWYGPVRWPLFFFKPFSYLFQGFIGLRAWCYKKNIFRSYFFSVPVIVVGNLSVGGVGKTPVVMALARMLQAQGYRPGVVSRGHGGSVIEPTLVLVSESAARVGDEALLLAQSLSCPVVVGKNRAEAVQFLLSKGDCHVVISDDGLQHYAMGRAIEIVVVDGERRFGNGYCLPAGPLREPVLRLKSVDFVLVNGEAFSNFHLTCSSFFTEELFSIDQQQSQPWEFFRHQTVHAVAGIGHPERFFEMLRQRGLMVIPHVFPDHHPYSAVDLNFDDEHPIVMTEKDAVKCGSLQLKNAWVAPITLQLPSELIKKVLIQLQKKEAM